MSTKNANFRVLLQDLKISFKFAVKNLVSFVLGMIGVLIVTGLLIALLALFVLVPFLLLGGLTGITDLILTWVRTTQSLQGAAAFLMTLLLVTPLIAPLMVAIGALYGMGREIVESEGTTAEGIFAWYSKKFFSLAAVGMIQFLVVIVPLAVTTILLGPLSFGLEQTGWASATIATYSIYATFMSGLMSLAFPAVIDGNSILSSIKISVRLSTRYFDRVFSTWLSYLGIGTLLSFPLLAWPLAVPLSSSQVGMWTTIIAAYSIIAVLFTFFVLLPATVIGMSRIYMILISDNLSGSSEFFTESFDDDDVSIIGGD